MMMIPYLVFEGLSFRNTPIVRLVSTSRKYHTTKEIAYHKISNASTDEIITRTETKNTKENTRWAVRVSESKFYCFNDVYLSTFL